MIYPTTRSQIRFNYYVEFYLQLYRTFLVEELLQLDEPLGPPNTGLITF
jgi:hypothetical protein